MWAMSEDLVPVANAVAEVEPAMQAFAEATGILGPIQELAQWATDLIRYRRAPHQAKLLKRAAEKIKATGLPASAVPDKLLRIALEDGAMEDDPSLQERWTNLLANAATDPSRVHPAFPRMLSEMDSRDARILDAAHVEETTDVRSQRIARMSSVDNPDWPALENLGRLGLIYNEPATAGGRVYITPLGALFVRACEAPEAG